MTMGKITLDKESQKSADDIKAAINNATQQNKSNTKTAADPKVTITIEKNLTEKKVEVEETVERCYLVKFVMCVLLIIGLIASGWLLYLHLNFFCTGVFDVEGQNIQEQYEALKQSYRDLNTRHEVLMKRNAICMTKFATTLPGLQQIYDPEQLSTILSQFGEAIQPAIID